MGCVWTIIFNGLLGLGGYWAARYGFRQPPGLPRGLAAFTLAWTWATLGIESLGVLGLLNLAALLGWVVLGLLAGAMLRRIGSSNSIAVSSPAERNWELSATLSLGLVLWGAIVLGAQSLLLPVKVVSDGPIYHLYFAARWWKEGRLSLIATPFGENAATYFPAVGDLALTWFMTTWGGDRLARVGQFPFLIAAAFASFAIARRLGAGVTASVVAVGWFVSSMPLFLFSFEPNVDTIFVAGYLLAVFFLIRYFLDGHDARSLVLGGLAAGGALGTKPTAVIFIPVLLLFAALGMIRGDLPLRRKVAHLVVMVLACLVMPAFFFGRNAWLTGNPLYPLHVELFGKVWLSGWYRPEAMVQSQYYIPVGHWRACLDILLAVFDPRLVPLWAASLLGFWAVGQRRQPLDAWVWACAGLAVLNIALYWFLIPYRTQQRFMLQSLGLGAVPLARLLDRSRVYRMAAAFLLVLHFVTPQSWPFASRDQPIPWDLSGLFSKGIPPLLNVPISPAKWGKAWSSASIRGPVLFLIGVGAASFVAAWCWGRLVKRPTWRRFLLASFITAGAAVTAGVIVYPWDVPQRWQFYPNFPDYARGWPQLELLSGSRGARLAYAGTNLPYYLLGSGLRNDVRYVNIDAHPGWLLHDYHLTQSGRPATWDTPRPGWDRIHPDYDAWLANLRSEGIQYLVVARANPVEGRHNIADRQLFPIERQWAESHPDAFTPVYGVVEHDPEFRIYRVKSSSSGRQFDESATDLRARSH